MAFSRQDYPVQSLNALTAFLSSPENVNTNFIKYGVYPIVLQNRLLQYYVPTQQGFAIATCVIVNIFVRVLEYT